MRHMRFLLALVLGCLINPPTGWFNQLFAADSTITNGRAIAAFDSNRAYLITEPDSGMAELYRWDATALYWVIVANQTPPVRQIDCLSDGTKLIGTDDSDIVRKWSEVPGWASPWTDPQSGSFDWVIIDPVTEETRALIKDDEGAWLSWDVPTPVVSDPWYTHLPAGSDWSERMKTLWLVDRDVERFERWERGDMNYFVALNRGSGTNPFYIFYYGDDEDQALSRITDPPLLTHNIDDVVVSQISYDEQYQNLWCVDNVGTPWQWDNVEQEWIERSARSEDVLEGPYSAASNLFREDNDYYVRTTYIQGVYSPVLIVFRDTKIMHLILGELSRSDMSQTIDIIIFEEKERSHDFHNVLLRPRETPQKIVRIDSGKRIRENHYLERLLIDNGIIADEFAISVFPAEHRLLRR